MKVIFLDVDGVLNCAHTEERIRHLVFVEDAKIELLKEIVDRTGAEIVLSSSWRIGWWDLDHGTSSGVDVDDFIALRDKLREFGLEMVDYTPRMSGIRRGEEITAWLKYWKGEQIESFVILDDLSRFYMRPNERYLVHTDFEEGLARRHVEQAVEILGEGSNCE